MRWRDNLGPSDEVTLAVSKNGGLTYQWVIVPRTFADGVHVVSVLPRWSTTRARLRINWLGHPTVSDVSDGSFCDPSALKLPAAPRLVTCRPERVPSAPVPRTHRGGREVNPEVRQGRCSVRSRVVLGALAPASRQVAVAAQEPAVGATASQDVTPAAGFFTFSGRPGESVIRAHANDVLGPGRSAWRNVPSVSTDTLHVPARVIVTAADRLTLADAAMSSRC